MKRNIIVILIFFCVILLSSCVTYSYKYFDYRDATKSVFSVADGKTVKFKRTNLYGRKRDPRERSKKYGYEVYGTGWATFSKVTEGDGGTSLGLYRYGECDSVFFYNRKEGKIVDGWRVLSADEWDYLLFKRETSTVCGVKNARFVRGTLNLKKGIVIFPDNYKHPRGVPEIFGANDISGFPSDNDFGYENGELWSRMEKAGAVFIVQEDRLSAHYVDGYLTSTLDEKGNAGFFSIGYLKVFWRDRKGLNEGIVRLVIDE